MKIVASIQARMNSTRFPGKVLKKICGKPILLWQIERLKKSRLIDEIIVATSTNKKDLEIISFCSKNNIKSFTGSENDVLDRISSLIKKNNVNIHIECFGDSPLIDPEIVDQFIGFFLKNNNYDFVSNTLKTSYPAGMEVMIYHGSSLIAVNDIIEKNDGLREHAGYNITRFPKKFSLKNLEAPFWYKYPELHLEIDEPIDLDLIKEIIQHFKSKNIEFYNLSNILQFIKTKPELGMLNSSVKRRWKDLQK